MTQAKFKQGMHFLRGIIWYFGKNQSILKLTEICVEVVLGSCVSVTLA